MQEKIGKDEKYLSDADLNALAFETRNDTGAHEEFDEIAKRLDDFAMELLRRRLFKKVEFLQLIERKPPN